MIVRRKQRPATQLVVQVLDRCPGDGEAVKGRRAAADLVQDHQGARPGLVEDRGGFHHLHHEGGASSRQIVRRADPGEQPIDHADMRRGRRHEAADLRQDGDQCVLAQIGAFAGHVRAGDQPQPLCRVTVRRQVAVVGDEGVTIRGQHRLHHRMPPGLDPEGQGIVDDGPGIAAIHRQFRQRAQHVEHSQRFRRTRQIAGAGRHLARQVVEQLQLQGQRAVAGLQDAGLQFRQFHRSETHGVRHGLAVDEAVVAPQALRLRLADLDEIAQHIVVLDPQVGGAGLVCIAFLQCCDVAATVVAQGPQLVQFGRVAGSDKAAVAGVGRKLVCQRPPQPLDQRPECAQLGQGLAQQVGAVVGKARGCIAKQHAQDAGDSCRLPHRRQIARAAAFQ